jgi:pimeloyl-ACP methyl ester carboxylesterase
MNNVAATSDAGRYANVNGLRLYYEVHGTGAPLVLLHGGVAGLAMLGTILPALTASRQVIAVELQGHGRTADVDRPLRYETMADDIAALLAHLGVTRADVMGYSRGGGVALQMAIRHADRVRNLVVMSTVYARSGSSAPPHLARGHPDGGCRVNGREQERHRPSVTAEIAAL